jgi:hypothetical protein
MVKEKKSEEPLKGWAAIAKFLGQPVSTLQRWATEGMPLTRIGRYVGRLASRVGALAYAGGWREGDRLHPVRKYDLLADLKRGLSEARKAHRKNSRS